jgi:hypothetical protein
MESPIVALAFPLCPDVMPIQFCEADALQEQPASVVRSNARRPPTKPIVSPLRLSENWHGAAACVTSTWRVPTAIVPERAAGTVLAAIEYPIDASPWPDRAPLIVTQPVSVETVQVQSRAVAMLNVAFPPVAVKLDVDVLARTSHRASLAVGVVREVSAEVHAVNTRAAKIGKMARPNISNTRST